MIEVKGAFSKAAEFAYSTLDAGRTQGLQLEEVELAKQGGSEVWLITLSMFRPNPFGGLEQSPTSPRDYKVFAVDRETGQVLSMKIRELASVE